MTHIDADKLIAEIERRLHFDNNWIEGDKRRQKRTSGVSSAYYKRIGSKHACESLLDFVISHQQEQPSLPSGLDDAAEKYSENILANNEDLQDAIEDAFKAGAEWVAGHGWHDVTEMPSIFGFYLVIHEKGWCVANYMGKGVVCESGWVEVIHHIEIEHPQRWLDLRDLIPKNRPQ